MDVSSIAAFATADAQARTQEQASLMMLKKTMEMQEQQAEMMLQVLQVSSPSGSSGGVIDTWA
tara:strand:- start:440 stop:628 length:189 start_codon:yes stop_codon:yes gene_type:complete